MVQRNATAEDAQTALHVGAHQGAATLLTLLVCHQAPLDLTPDLGIDLNAAVRRELVIDESAIRWPSTAVIQKRQREHFESPGTYDSVRYGGVF